MLLLSLVANFDAELGKYVLIWCLQLNYCTSHALLGVNKHTWL